MLNRQMKRVTVQERSDERDEYGYQQDYTDSFDINAAIMLYSQQNTNDVRYKDATHVAITHYMGLNDSMRLKCGDKTYKVILSNNEGRMAQIMLKEVLDGGRSILAGNG